MEENKKYASVLIPLAIPRVYDYSIPKDLEQQVIFGIRVEVSIKNKLYSGIIVEIHENAPVGYKTKDIISLLDKSAIITPDQYRFWKWIANYYCCTLGEVMNVALPSGLKLSSETKIILSQHGMEYMHDLTDDEYLVAEALSIQEEIPLYLVQEILQKKTVYPIIRSLMDKNILMIKEELKRGFKPKLDDFIKLEEKYFEKGLTAALELTTRSEKQTRAILAFSALCKELRDEIPKKLLYESADVNSTDIKKLVEKGIFQIVKREGSRIKKYTEKLEGMPEFSEEQQRAYEEIVNSFKTKHQLLLHGVTGSGKTWIYMKLIQDMIRKKKQVLYLLPEIGLTTQIIERLQAVFGDKVAVYHSRLNNHERVEIWKKAHGSIPVLLGARSSLFLPFKNLGLIIVDEEHDTSFKQVDPAPRYNARDAAIVLSSLSGAKVVLGTATPSVETYHNVHLGKYDLVKMNKRFGNVALPETQIIDLKIAYHKKLMKSVFSVTLLEAMMEALSKGEQILIFQNRRGYAPTMKCEVCNWHAECTNCDVKLTVHKYFNQLRCHYCGKKAKLPEECPRCGSKDISKLGFGTEKIEDELKLLLPEAKIKRMDYDTTKTKTDFQRIISQFADGEIDILVGTQMVTKGLDFDNISLVGVLNADKIINFPDFRAHERAFQLFTQVSGRAGRKNKQGKVIIQTFDPRHPIILDTINNDFDRFVRREISERKKFIYPPFFKLIYIHVKHKNPKTVHSGAQILADMLEEKLGKRVLGPTEPGISRVRAFYLRDITIKAEKNNQKLSEIKAIILDAKSTLIQSDGYKSLRINIDVDPF